MKLFEILMKFGSRLNLVLVNDQPLETYLGSDFEELEDLMSTDTWDDVTDVTYANYSGNDPQTRIKQDVIDRFEDFDLLDVEVGFFEITDGKLDLSL